MSVSVDDNLELVSNELPSSTIVHVKKGTGTPFNIKIRPLSVEFWPVFAICALIKVDLHQSKFHLH